MTTITLTTNSTITITELITNSNTSAVFTHPTTGYVLTDKWQMDEIQNATSLQTAMDAGSVVVYRDGIPINSLNQIMPKPPLVVQTVSATTAVTDATDTVVFNGPSGQTLTLPRPQDNRGDTITIKNISASDVNVVTSAGTIDGYTTITFTGGSKVALSIVSDGTDWRAI